MSEAEREAFAEKLARLIRTVHPPDRGPYSYREIAAGVHDHPGAMTAAYVQQLANGKQPNPRKHYIEALATYFGVPVSYFFDDKVTRQVDAEIAGVLNWRDTEAGEIAQRINTLSPAGRNAVSTMIDSLAAYERPERVRDHQRSRSSTDNADA